MNTRTIETMVSGLNELEQVMVTRTATRRDFLRNATKALGFAAAAGLALPATATLAAPTDRGFKARPSNQPPVDKGGKTKTDSLEGIENLRGLAFNLIDPEWQFGLDWDYFPGESGESFYYPHGWKVDELTGVGQTGAWFAAPDKSALIGAFELTTRDEAQARDAAWRQIDKAIGNRSFEVIVDDERRTNKNSNAFVAISVSGYYLTVHCFAIPTARGARERFEVQFAAIEDFDQAAEEYFLPFVCQGAYIGCFSDCTDVNDGADE